MSRISIGQAYEPVEIDLWEDNGGGVFVTEDLPRSKQKKAEKLLGAVYETEEGGEDVAVDAIGQFLDLKLVPKNGTKVKPSTLVSKKWKADELTMRQLLAFLQAVAEADRPT
jgi:hypothetical protein